jgi:hypothetical protein
MPMSQQQQEHTSRHSSSGVCVLLTEHRGYMRSVKDLVRAGLVPLYLKHKYKAHGVFHDARTLVAIHNLAHQGTALAPEFPLFNLPQAAYQELEWIYTEPDGRRTPVRTPPHSPCLHSPALYFPPPPAPVPALCVPMRLQQRLLQRLQQFPAVGSQLW